MDGEDDVFDFNIKPKITPEEWFTLFTDTTSCSEALEIFANLKNTLGIRDGEKIYEKIKAKLTSWKCQSLWDLIDTKAKHVEYGKGTICSHLNVLIIGAGPIGLRTAIETTLLGCRTVIVEKRTEFNRNNVLHLWPFLLSDFRSLGAKKFYGKFCAGSIDHISIRKLQSILLKVCLIVGVEIYTGVEFKKLLEPTNEYGWRAQFSPYREKLDKFTFDIVVGADGKKDMLPGFPQIEMRGALAIGITCNFVNENTMAEAGVEEISGVAYQYNPRFFEDLYEQFGVRLENIVYYKDETHYFVMTALKSSLLAQGVCKQDYSEPSKLLEKQNVDLDKLIEYTLNTVHYATNYKLPSDLKLKQNENGTPDIAVFDFTSLKKAGNASRIMERKGKRLLLALVGDSLLEPFWPTGSGCARGVLSALDLAWMIRLYGMKMPPLAVLRERENVFKLLSVTDSKDLQKNHKAYTINPTTRYSNLNQVQPFNIAYLKKLYDTDDPENADYTFPEPVVPSRFDIGSSAAMPPPRSKRKSVGKRRLHSASSNKRRSDRTTLREAKHVSKTAAMWEKRIPNNVSSGPAKRTKPSHSGSGSCTLESVSESEEATGPYQRAMCLRKKSQNDEKAASVFTDSSADEVETFEDERVELLHGTADSTSAPGASRANHEGLAMETRDDHEKKGHRFGTIRKLLGKGKGDHSTERRKSVVARRSVSKARRLRRKSGTAGGHAKHSRPEAEHVSKTAQKGGPHVSVHKRENDTKGSQDDVASKMPSERTLSAKALIAAAEARDKENVSKSGVLRKELLKRKADAIADDAKAQSYENVPWSHYLPVVQPLLKQDKDNNSQDASSAVQEASQLAGLILLAVPLLLPCRVRLVGKPANMLSQKRNTLLRSSTEKRETRKISVTRAGSVQRAVEQLQTKIGQETSTNLRRNRLSENYKRDSFHSSGRGSPSLTQSTEENQPQKSELPVNTDDYEIIDIKNGLPKEYLRTEDEFDIISGSEIRLDAVDGGQRIKKMTKKKTGKKKPSEILRDLLSMLCREQRLTSMQITLEMLSEIHMSIARKPSQEKFYRIYTKGRDFETYVWKIETCRQFLKQVGWQICGSFIVLSRSQPIEEPLKCIQEAKREVEQLLNNQYHSSKKRPSPDEVLNVSSSYLEDGEGKQGKISLLGDPATKLEAGSESGDTGSRVFKEDYIDLDDSYASSSSYEDALESSEGYIGDENYLIVDFAASKSKEKSEGKMKENEDSAYGKDGRRRRRRYKEADEQTSEGIVQTERVPLRQRLKQGRSENVQVSGDEKNKKNTEYANLQTARDDQEKIADDDLYDQRGRRRRNRREKATRDEPPDNENSARRSGQNQNQLNARETTTTPPNAAEISVGEPNELQKRLVTDHAVCVEDKYLSPVNSAMAEDDITSDSSKVAILPRLEGLRRESSDSSGSDTGKKKKLVLKRGSMRRKKVLEEENSGVKETSSSEAVSSVKTISGVTMDSSTTDTMDKDNSESCKQSEAKADLKISERVEKLNANFLTEVTSKNSSNTKEKHRETVEVTGSIKSRIADLMANMNADSNKGKDVGDVDTVVNGSINEKADINRDDVKRTPVNGDDAGSKGGQKAEKKRKLVLKVKRKKNLKVNDNKTETIETSPAKPCDFKHVGLAGKEEVVAGSKGRDVGANGKEKEERRGEEESIGGSYDSANGNKGIANGTSKLSEGEQIVPKRDIAPVIQEDRLAQNGTKFDSNGYGNGKGEIEPVLDHNSVADKKSLECKQGNNGNLEKNDAEDDSRKESQETGKPKKKKFVLKRKKKVEC